MNPALALIATADFAPGVLEEAWRVLTFRAGMNAGAVLLGTTLLGLACGVVGSFLVLRRRALVADALSHAALPGVALGFLLATLLGGDGKSLPVLLLGAGVFGLLGVAVLHLLAALPRVKEDAAIGAVLSVFFALGMVLLGLANRTPGGNQAGLNRFIFGQAASLSRDDLTLIITLTLIALIVPLALFKELRLICFDGSFARSLGWPTLALDGALMAVVTLITVAGLHAVGALLMVALLIVPAAAARFWTNHLATMVLLAAMIGALGAMAGTTLSAVVRNLPTGPLIVLACGLLFLVSFLFAPRRGLIAKSLQFIAVRRALRAALARGALSFGEEPRA